MKRNVVAQTGSLLYRRLATCEVFAPVRAFAPADCQSATQQVTNLRYLKGGLK